MFPRRPSSLTKHVKCQTSACFIKVQKGISCFIHNFPHHKQIYIKKILKKKNAFFPNVTCYKDVLENFDN